MAICHAYREGALIFYNSGLHLAIKKCYKRRMFYECKKSQNTQVVHKNLHILGPIYLFFITLKPSLVQ